MSKLKDSAMAMSSAGKTYQHVADNFNSNGYIWDGRPRNWTRRCVELLMTHDDPDHGKSVAKPTARVATPHTPQPAPQRVTTDRYPAAEFMATALKMFGGLSLLGGIVMAMVVSGDDTLANEERATAITIFLASGFASLVLWWSFATVIDLLRTIAEKTVAP